MEVSLWIYWHETDVQHYRNEKGIHSRTKPRWKSALALKVEMQPV